MIHLYPLSVFLLTGMKERSSEMVDPIRATDCDPGLERRQLLIQGFDSCLVSVHVVPNQPT